MKLLALIAIALGLMSANPAEARHHHRHHNSELGLSFGRAVAHDVRNHLPEAGGPTSPSSASTYVPMPRERPTNMVNVLDRSRSRSMALLDIPQAAGTGHATTEADDGLPQHVVLIRLYEYGLQRLQTDDFYWR
jgi:hypothetical protein